MFLSEDEEDKMANNPNPESENQDSEINEVRVCDEEGDWKMQEGYFLQPIYAKELKNRIYIPEK